MKQIAFLFLLFIPLLSYSQEVKRMMTLEEGKIYYDGLKLKLSEAKDIALSGDKIAAYEYFKSAKKIKSWNVVWAIAGGWELATGTMAAISGNPIGLIDAGLGVGLIFLTTSRNKKAERKMQKGVEAFNK